MNIFKLIIIFSAIVVCGCDSSSSEYKQLEQAQDASIISPMPDISADIELKPTESRHYISGGQLGQGWHLQIQSGSASPSKLEGGPNALAHTQHLHAYRTNRDECDSTSPCLTLNWLSESVDGFGIFTLSKSRLPKQKIDLTQDLQNAKKLIIQLKVLNAPEMFSEKTKFRVELGSSEELDNGEFTTNYSVLDLRELMAKVPQNEWKTIGVPLSCFVGGDFNISDVSHISIAGYGRLEMRIGALNIGSNSEIDSKCSG